MESVKRENDDFLDELICKVYELNGGNDGLDDCEIHHLFTPGLYTRTYTMPANKYIISKEHKTEHPFVVLAGAVEVSIDAKNSVLFLGGDKGVTKAGTRRILKTIRKTVWMTFHPTNIFPESTSEEDVIKAAQKVEDIIIEKRDYKFLQTDKKDILCHSQ